MRYIKPRIVKESKLGFWQLRAIKRGDFDMWDAKAVDAYWAETLPVTGIEGVLRLISLWCWAVVFVFVALGYVMARVQSG